MPRGYKRAMTNTGKMVRALCTLDPVGHSCCRPRAGRRHRRCRHDRRAARTVGENEPRQRVDHQLRQDVQPDRGACPSTSGRRFTTAPAPPSSTCRCSASSGARTPSTGIARISVTGSWPTCASGAGADTAWECRRTTWWHRSSPGSCRTRTHALAAFFGHRDFRDYFNRHGAKATATFNMSTRSSFSVDWSDERWSSPQVRSVLTVFGNGKAWRANPVVDAGRFHIGVARANIDTRNDEINPSTGWLILAEYERGSGERHHCGSGVAARATVCAHRADVRPRAASICADTTACLRRHGSTDASCSGDGCTAISFLSSDGSRWAGSGPFRDSTSGSISPGRSTSRSAAMAARRLRAIRRSASASPSLSSSTATSCTPSFFDFLNSRPIRLRGIGFTVRPTAVAFVDAGRGWLVGPPSGTLQYSSRSFPRFGTFRTDVGLGLDLGIIGVYVAKAVSTPKEPANVFLRVHRRF